MSKLSIILLFLLPSIAWAECGFTSVDGNMVIVVGNKSNKCFSSTAFRENFKSELVATMKALDDEVAPSVAQKKAFDQRNERGQKLWAIAERRHQATTPGARYFGQVR